jgi:hypothetical protein
MSIGNAHSHANGNTERNSYADPNSDSTATDTNGNSNGHTYCDRNSDSTATDSNGNSNGHTYCDRNSDRYGYSNSNAYCESNPWECLLSANDGEPCSCFKRAVEFYGSGERDRCDLKDNFKRRSRSQLQWI